MYEFYYPDEKPIAVIDGELNPSYFRPLEPPTPEEIQQREEERKKEAEREKIFKDEYKKLYRRVKDLVVRLKNGKIIVLNLKDPKYGWLIRWKVRDLLREVVLKRKLGFDKYGQTGRLDKQVGFTLWGYEIGEERPIFQQTGKGNRMP